MSTCAERSTAVLVFARAPVAGEAKTRMEPLLGRDGAARLQARLTEHALATARDAAIGPVELWCSPRAAHPFFVDCAKRFSVALRDQSGDSLGARIERAIAEALRTCGAVLVIGTDAPALTPAHLQSAAHALSQHDLVVLPAEDGGYVLLGTRDACPEAFVGIDWGSERVLAQTLQNLTAARRRVYVAETLWDVDRPSDFRRLLDTLPGWDDVAR